MRNESTFECTACGATKEHDAAKGHLPQGWSMIRVMGEVGNFCEACRVHFDCKTPGEDNQPENISPRMRKMLGIDEDD